MSTQVQYAFCKLGSLLLNCKDSLYILHRSPLSDTWLANIFSHSEGNLFTFLMTSLEVEKFLIVMKSNLSTFCLLVLLVLYVRNHCLIQVFFPMDFIVLALLVRSLIYFYMMWGRSILHLSQHHLLFFSPFNCFGTLILN